MVGQNTVGRYNIDLAGIDYVFKEIAGYCVMRSPPLVIKRKVKSVESVPAETQLKSRHLKHTDKLKTQQDA